MNGLLNYLLECSLILGIGVLFYKGLLEHLTFFHWNRIFLLALLACTFILPAITFNLAVDTVNPVQTINNSLNWIEMRADSKLYGSDRFSVSWSGVLFIAYVIGVLIFLVRLLVGILKTVQRIHRSEKVKIGSHYLVVSSGFIPASFFRFILLPCFDPQSSEHRQIIMHESVHVEKFHSIDILLAQFAKVVLWFNPLIFLLEKSLRESHEFQADQVVTKSYSPIAYSRLLLKQLSADCGLQFMNNFNQFQTKKRIIMMNKTKSDSMLKGRFLLTIPLVALMIGLFSCDMAGNNEKITGTWAGSDFSFEQTEGADMSAMIEGGKQLHLDGKLIISEDGTYKISVGQQENGSGTWELKGDEFITIDGNGNKVIYKVEDLTDNQLVTVQEVKTDTPMGTIAGKITLTYSR